MSYSQFLADREFTFAFRLSSRSSGITRVNARHYLHSGAYPRESR
ncbi:Uncharacterised protein [Bordetella holmesii]|nr:Uncharacterised protein [Bordetella holmesii]